MRTWLQDMFYLQPDDYTRGPLTREAFVQKYFPKYVNAWQPDHRIRLNKSGRPTHATEGTTKGQNTKRQNIIDGEFEKYLATFASEKRRMESYNQPELL